MKKNIALALSLLMVAGSIVACGKKGGDKTSSTPAPESSVPAATSEAHVHSFSQWAVSKEATHTEEGEETRTCVCGEKETRPIAKTTDHEFGDWTTTTPATCTTDGKKERTCACGEKETETIAATGHTYSAQGICESCKDDCATEIYPGGINMTASSGKTEYVKFEAYEGKFKFALSGGSKPSEFNLFDPDGKKVEGAEFGNEFDTVAGYYRASWKSNGSSPYVLENTSHEHVYDYDGMCEYCSYSIAKTATQSESATTTLSCATTEVLYYTITLRAGTYTLSWNATCLDYVKIYNDEGLKLVDATGATEIKAATFTLAESTVCHVVLGPSSGCMGFNIKVA